MIPVSLGVVRVFVHVLAASIWVGGQVTLAALVPVLRVVSPTAPRTVARRFNLVAWPAYAALIATGIWNIFAVRAELQGAYRNTLIAKLCVVAISGGAAYLHTRARSTTGLAVWGAITGVSALGALLLGVLLAG